MAESTYQLELLDTEEHHALQTWSLDGSGESTLGRARTNHIVIASPLVSRAHARLLATDGGCRVESLSELGVWSRGRQHQRLDLSEGDVFRLGEYGPALRLASHPGAAVDLESTIRFRPENLGILRLDESTRDREVAEIVESDFFKQLQQRAGRLRASVRGEEPASRTSGPESDREGS